MGNSKVSWSISVQFSSVTQSCPTVCDPKDCSMPGFLIHHQLPALIQTHVHRVSDAIQPSHPLSYPPAPIPPSIRVFSNESTLRMRWPKPGSWKKQESCRKTSISALLTMPKPLTVWITINCGKF